MEVTKMTDEQMGVLKQAAGYIDMIVELIDMYEGCRYGSMAFTKLEECMHWMNALTSTGKLKDKTFKTESPLIQTTQ